jgi:hypothetical protein
MRHPPFPRSGRRPGKILVLFTLLLPVLLGMIGLVIDGGLMMAAQRRTQNAADAAALAAALDLMRGTDTSTALTTAQSFLDSNGVSGVTLTLNGGAGNALNIPPQDPGSTGSPYLGKANYAEVILTLPLQTLFIQVLGVNANQSITARAVAGFEPVGSAEGAIVLNPNVSPGIAITSSNARLIVNGTLVVNSSGEGQDQYGNTVGSLNQPAITTGGASIVPAPVVARHVQVVGGVDVVDNVRAYDPAFSGSGYYYDPSNPNRPLFAGAPTASDPLQSLPTPTTSSLGAAVNNRSLGSPSISSNSASGVILPNTYDLSSNTLNLNPGVYSGISISGGTVYFAPGIYVLAGGGLSMNGGTVSGSGVMFYNTGSDYNPSDGTPDTNDGDSLGTPPPSTSFGSISINGGTVTLTPLSVSGSPFNNLLIYQRRWNTQSLTVGASGGGVNLSGTSYARWANFQLAGPGPYNAQLLVGQLSIGGNAAVTLNATGRNYGRANLVFLVE